MKNNKVKFFALLLLCFLTISFSTSGFAETNSNEPDNYVQARVIADQTQVSGGDIIRLGLEQTIYPDWHIYWKNPGDSGTPTIINWDLPDGFSVSDFQWPIPQKIPYPPLTNYGHENEAILLQNLSIPEGIGPDPIILKASVDLLVCHDICIPETHNVSLTLNGSQQAEPEKIATAEKKRPIFKDWESVFYKDGSQFILKIITDDFSDISIAKNIIITPEDWGAINNGTNSSIKKTKDGFILSHKAGERDYADFENLPVVVTYEVNGDKKAFRVVADNNPQKITANNTSELINENNTKQKSSIGFVQAIIFALLGGIVLNLMPCVFPVLSMKALSLVKLSNKEEKEARHYGLSYTIGILFSFAIMAATLLILKAGGAQIGWGFQLQNHSVVIFLIYLIFALGLNLAGFFEFSGRLSGVGHKLSQKPGNRGAFFTGVLATIVATPCAMPFMGVAMGFALTQPAVIAMIVFLALGFGLALPLLSICFIAPLRTALPKPGAWMETFRQFLSFPMFLTAAFLLWVLLQQVNSIIFLCVLVGLIFIVFTIWFNKIKPKNGFKKIIGYGVILLSVAVILAPFKIPNLNADQETENQSNQIENSFTPETLNIALEKNNPIFVNMTAAWCASCKVNEIAVLRRKKTKTLFSNSEVIYIKGDWTKYDPEITQYLASFDRQGVPLYVYYGAPDNQTGKRPDPIVLPTILTFGLLKKTIQN